MSENESRGQRIARLSRPVRTLSEAFGIKTQRLLALAQIFTDCIKHDESGIDSMNTVRELLREKKISDTEALFLAFDFGWLGAGNAIMKETEKSILGVMLFDKTTGELEDY